MGAGAGAGRAGGGALSESVGAGAAAAGIGGETTTGGAAPPGLGAGAGTDSAGSEAESRAAGATTECRFRCGFGGTVWAAAGVSSGRGGVGGGMTALVSGVVGRLTGVEVGRRGAGRNQSVPASSTSTSPPTPTSSRRLRRRGAAASKAGTVIAVVGAIPLLGVARASSRLITSRADCGRSAGRLARQAVTSAANGAGTAGRRRSIGSGVSTTWAASTA